MGDEQIGQVLLGLELVHQVQHLSPDGHVQGGDGLVGHDELGVHDHGPGDAHALALAAGKLVGIPGFVFGQQTHVLERLVYLGDPLLLIPIEMEVVEALGHAVLDSGPLVQRGGGVLEDHLDIADHVAVLLPADLAGDALALELDFACAAGIDPKDGAAERGLAGAGLAHQSEGLALVDVEVGVLHGHELLFAGTEGDVHMLDGEDDLPVNVIVRHGTTLPYPSSS